MSNNATHANLETGVLTPLSVHQFTQTIRTKINKQRKKLLKIYCNNV